MNRRPAFLVITFLFPLSVLVAQEKDSISLEMQRLNRLGDSLYKERLKKDSAYYEMLNRTASDIQNIKNEAQQKQLEEATQQVMQQQEKEQKNRRRTMWLGLTTFLVVVLVAGTYFKRKKNRP